MELGLGHYLFYQAEILRDLCLKSIKLPDETFVLVTITRVKFVHFQLG